MPRFSTPVQNYMSSPVHAVEANANLSEVYQKMSTLSISSLAVADENGHSCGVVTRTDLLREGRRQAGSRREAALLTFPKTPVKEFMTADVATVGPDESIEQACQIMLENNYHRIYIEAGKKFVGVLSTRDVMHTIAEQRLNKPLSAYMSSPVFTVRAQEPLSLASERLQKARVTGLVVMDGDWPVGLFTQTVALSARELSQDTPVEEVMDSAMLLLHPEIPLFRAAAQAAAMDVRRVVAWDGGRAIGILTGLDFARAASLQPA